MQSSRVARHPVHGVLLLDKPLGWSSNDALQKAKWLLQAAKAGHTGTLDPLATGVLPLCFGAATKFSQGQLDADKSYAATLSLGVTTTTGDTEGDILLRQPVAVTADDVVRVTRLFTRAISQIPPMYSALKKDGRALYDYARAGLVVDRAPRQIEIYALQMVLMPDYPEHPAIQLTVKCSKGTYIRTLAEDIGQALGCGAHLRSLRRTATGPYALNGCITLADLTAMTEGERLARLLPVDSLLYDHATVRLDAADADRFLNGLPRKGNWADADRIAVYRDCTGSLLGTAHVSDGQLIPRRLLSLADITQITEVVTSCPH